MVCSFSYLLLSGVLGLDSWLPYFFALCASLLLAPSTVLCDVWLRDDLGPATRWQLTQQLMFDFEALLPAFDYLLAGGEERSDLRS